MKGLTNRGALTKISYLPEFLWPWRKTVGHIGTLRTNLYSSIHSRTSPIISLSSENTLSLEMANAAKRRSEQGLNPESFAARVDAYEKSSVDGVPEAAKMSGNRSYRLLSVAYEISPTTLIPRQFADVGLPQSACTEAQILCALRAFKCQAY